MRVRGQLCHPFFITKVQIGKPNNLRLLLGTISNIHKYTETPFSVVLDENIHYRIMKLCNSSTYVSRHFRPLLSKCPPLFWILRPYTYGDTDPPPFVVVAYHHH